MEKKAISADITKVLLMNSPLIFRITGSGEGRERKQQIGLQLGSIKNVTKLLGSYG